MSPADLDDHVIGVDPDSDRLTAVVICLRTEA